MVDASVGWQGVCYVDLFIISLKSAEGLPSLQITRNTHTAAGKRGPEEKR